MIGFKELVQNFKDGLPELKDIGKEGLGILGDCAKVAGEFALEGAKAAGNFAADGARFALGSGGLKLTESNESTIHEYTDWTLDDIRNDQDYLSMFRCAMEEIVEKRTYDDYVIGCARHKIDSARVLGGYDKKMLWLLQFKQIEVNVGVYESRNVRILISTPNARQLAWAGDALQRGYEISSSDFRTYHRRSIAQADQLESFLGVAFCHDYHEFAIADQIVQPYGDDVVALKEVKVVEVKANVFLDFAGYQAIIASSALVPDWKDKIIGMACTISPSAVGDAREFMKKVRAILKHKYGGNWAAYSLNIKGGNIYLIQTKDGTIKLMAVSDEYGRYRNAVDVAYKETAEYKQRIAQEEAERAERERIENERKAEKKRREQARKDAIALKEKQRAEEIAARQAAAKAELSNALDAL